MGKTLTPSSSLVFSCKIYRNSKLFCQNCTKHWFLEKHSKILPWVRSYLTEIEYFYVFSSLNIWNIMTIFGMIGSISELDPKQQIYTLKQAREVWGVEDCTLLWLSWASANPLLEVWFYISIFLFNRKISMYWVIYSETVSVLKISASWQSKEN